MNEHVDTKGGEPRDWLWLLPLLAVLFMAFPLMGTVARAELADESFKEAAGVVAKWLLATNGDSEQRMEVAGGFGFLAVMATIVIGLAFSLPPEGVNVLPKRNRDVVEFLTFGVIFLVSLFAGGVLWAMVWWQVTFELILILISAWLVSLVAALVNLKRPLSERVEDATREKVKLHTEVERSGFVKATKISLGQTIRAEIVYWLIPSFAVPFLGWVGLIFDHRGVQIDPAEWALIVFLGSGALMVSIGWRVVASFPPHTRGLRLLSWFYRGLGILMAAAAAVAALFIRNWGFAVLSALAVGGVVAIYIIPAGSRWFRFMRTIRDAETIKRLNQADGWLSAVMREHDEQRESELESERAALLSQEGTREPMIRVDVFWPRSRSRSSKGGMTPLARRSRTTVTRWLRRLLRRQVPVVRCRTARRARR